MLPVGIINFISDVPHIAPVVLWWTNPTVLNSPDIEHRSDTHVVGKETQQTFSVKSGPILIQHLQIVLQESEYK